MLDNLLKITLIILLLILFSFIVDKNKGYVEKTEIHRIDITLIKKFLLLYEKPALKLQQKEKLDAVTFGYLPEWVYKKNGSALRYDLLTHIAIFSFNLNRKFEIESPKNWPWIDVIDSARIYNTKLIMTVFSEDSNRIHKVMMDFEIKNKFFSDLLDIVKTYGFGGVNIDFESVKRSERSGVINHFMQELTDFFHHEVPGSEVSIAGPAVNWYGLWDLYGLANSCDYIFIMGYCFFGSWSEITGPSSTLSGRKYCLDSTISSIQTGYGLAAQFIPEKLILGVPFFGNHWITKTADPHSKKIRYIKNKTYFEIQETVQKHNRIWQEDYKIPWLKYKADGKWHQLWYDDPQSLGLKYDLAASKGLKGIGIWALGYDGNNEDIWNDIDRRFRSSMPLHNFENPDLQKDVILVESDKDTNSTALKMLIENVIPVLPE